MNLTLTRGRRRRSPRVQREAVRLAADKAFRVFGLRVDRKNLDEDEQADLVALVTKLYDDSDGGNGWNLGRLARKEVARLEHLTEKGAGKAGHLAAQRDGAKLAKRGRELAAKAMRPPARPLLDEPGSLWFPQALIGLLEGQARRPGYFVFPLGDWGPAIALMFALENPERAPDILGPYARIVAEPNDDLAIEATDVGRYPVLSSRLDPEGRLSVDKSLTRLANAKFIEVERKGSTMKIRKGIVGRAICDRSTGAGAAA